MSEFTKGAVYGGMMKSFAQAFGDAMTDMPTGNATEVAFGTTQKWAGVTLNSVMERHRIFRRKHSD